MHIQKYFEEIESELQSLASPGIRPGLARLSKLLSLAGDPERAFPAVHVVGTNGKGSTAATIASILRESGYRTALYTSPHLVSFGERLEVDGIYVSPEKWYACISKIKKMITECTFFADNNPTYFELITAVSFMIIAEENVDIAVVEAGLGGRLDATNILKNVFLTLITPIGMDHTEYLGDTIQEIAHEKFSVIRKNTPAIFAGGNTELEAYFLEMAAKRGAYALLMPESCNICEVETSLNGTAFTLKTQKRTSTRYITPLIGHYQAENAALAIMGACVLKDKFPALTEASIMAGVKKTSWQGRLEKLADDPVLLVDGAHNPHAMKRLVETLLIISIKGGLNIVLAMMKDKDIRMSLEILKQLDPLIYCTQVPDMERSMKADGLCALVQECGLRTAGVWLDPIDAVNNALLTSSVSVCCGSLYLVGYIKARIDGIRGL
ncbi:MAG: bifunctional folylpolyglutamate synthase/dihydrofolate synthase [Synergistaceae bacterium]|nr:bifunctional folylpolyglutamate synthase/dihydrofolate synthase [Synergistaceae bacterium]